MAQNLPTFTLGEALGGDDVGERVEKHEGEIKNYELRSQNYE
jgi:hypothetical protein